MHTSKIFKSEKCHIIFVTRYLENNNLQIHKLKFFTAIYLSKKLSSKTLELRFSLIADDVVYQQTGVGGATLDKRRPDLRDELGYIAPPNRKLPPVPGSNYNTCDRIKRGTVISKPPLPTNPISR